MKVNKIITLNIFLLLVIVFLTACKRDNKSDVSGVLNVYNAGSYIDPITLKMFERDSGIKVVYDTFNSNEDLYVKLVQKDDAYDLICPSDYMIERLIKEDRLAKIDYKNIPNMKGVEKSLLNPAYDKENLYTVPYFWGTMGIIQNTSIIKDKIDSWSDFWNPKYKGKIIMYNSQRDSIAIALKYLGYSMNSKNLKELEAAKEALIKQKPLVYAYLTDDARDMMVQGEAGLCVMYSGDALLMMNQNPDLKYIFPKEGTNIWTDAWCIPKKAHNKKAAEEFINYMLKPEIASINAAWCEGYTSPVAEVKNLLPKEITDSYVAYPDIKNLPPLEAYTDLGDFVKVYDNIWTEVIATMK